MIRFGDIDEMIGADALDADQDRIGEVGKIYLDSEDGRPLWAAVASDRFETGSALVPLAGAAWDHGALRVAVPAALVREAPRVRPDAELTPQEQVRLHEHYRLPDTPGARGFDDEDPLGEGGLSAVGGSTPDLTAATAPADGPTAPGSEGEQQQRDGVAPTPDQRSEDGTTRTAAVAAQPAGAVGGPEREATAPSVSAVADTAPDGAVPRSGARLRLRVVSVTEQVTVTVPVSHDEVRIEVVPDDEANGSEDLEVVLTEQRPVLTVETVPVRRVRLGLEDLRPAGSAVVEVRLADRSSD